MLELCVTSTFLWFFSIFMGRSRYRVLKHGVGVKWDPRRTAAYVPSHFHGFEPHFLLCVSWKLWFFMKKPLVTETCKSAYTLDTACTMLEPSTFWVIMFFYTMGRSRYRVLKHGVGLNVPPKQDCFNVPCHFHSSKATKCEIFAWNCDFSGTTYHRDLKCAALDSACHKP